MGSDPRGPVRHYRSAGGRWLDPTRTRSSSGNGKEEIESLLRGWNVWDFVWPKGKAGGCCSPNREFRRRNGVYLGCGGGNGWVALKVHVRV